MCGLFHVFVLLVDLSVAETIIPLIESTSLRFSRFLVVNSSSNVSNFSAGTILQYAGYLADVTSNLSSAANLPMVFAAMPPESPRLFDRLVAVQEQ